jgi:molybdopterin converting factor small subunit
VHVRILTFAGVREIVGAAERTAEVPEGATVGRVWDDLASEFPSLREIARSTRLACNGALVERDAALHDGDELAVMPPFGGG